MATSLDHVKHGVYTELCKVVKCIILLLFEDSCEEVIGVSLHSGVCERPQCSHDAGYSV